MSRRDQDLSASASATPSDSANLSLDANQSQTIARRGTLPPEMFGVPYASSTSISLVNAGAAKEFVSEHREHIMQMAKVYRLDEMVLANVVYQERRHSGGDDWYQDRFGNKNDTGNLGPSQMSIDDLKGLIDRGKVHLTRGERESYAADNRQFCFDFLVDEKNGIRALAAKINDRLQTLENNNLIPDIPRDNDPRSLSLGQFVYGAALYSRGGRVDGSGNSDFDRLGPTSDQIDFKKNSIAGTRSLPNSDALTFSFHYLRDTYSALYGVEGPKTLGGYFNDRSIIRSTNRSASDDAEAPVVASSPRGAEPQPLARVGAMFGDTAQPGREVFDRIASQLQTRAPQLGEENIAAVAADLTPKSLAAGYTQPSLAINDQGRVFAYDANRPASSPVFSDPQTLDADSVARNVAKTREQSQNSALAQDAANPQAALATAETKPRAMG